MYAELHCKSHYTFLTGASSPEELVERAAELGYQAIAITDDCSYAGIVKAYQASKLHNIKLIVGSEFTLQVESEVEGEVERELESAQARLVLLAPNRTAYSEISALITRGRRRSKKGDYQLTLRDLQFGLRHCLAIWLPRDAHQCQSLELDQALGKTLKRYFKDRLWLGVELFWLADDQAYYLACQQMAAALDINLVACNDVHMHDKSRKPLQDTVTAIRLRTTVEQLGRARQVNAERSLKSLPALQHQYPAALLEETCHIAGLCHFSMDELRYQYPQELVPTGLTPHQYLSQLTYAGAKQRWPQGITDKVRNQLEYELDVINELNYEYYFLTVYDIVAFARQQQILCQGRGSAANSAVCYCLGITEVDPASSDLLFERFISKERNEPPDIDVDFENQRREEVIQYIYRKYTRKRTAMTATVITYRRRSALKDVGKALGLPVALIEELSKSMAWWDSIDMLSERLRERKFSVNSQLCQYYLQLVQQILGTPRHLSQHVGGFLITQSPTTTLVPIENAAMADRTVIQWDKYDIEILGMLKVDVLGLGMLTAIRKSIEMINQYQPGQLTLQSIPKEDPKVYDLLCAGDSIGLFQVESRAQMSMLPRLKPRKFYDLVIEVAIVRPGPIQGDMVHPYLKRRDGEEPVTYANDEIKAVLHRTLGVPIFQEQVIKLTMVAAGFSGGEADQLRRAMASWGKNGNLNQFKDKLITGMLQRGHSQEFAERLFKQMQGFGSYGFPESHAASFALLVYVSAWLKCYHPAAFYCGLLNSQPMGFYSPSQLLQDARRHHVPIRPICINHSEWDHTLDNNGAQIAIRLGLRLIKGLSATGAEDIIVARQHRAFASVTDLKSRNIINDKDLQCLIKANALRQVSENRREAYWQALYMEDPFIDGQQDCQPAQPTGLVPEPTPVEEMLADYHTTKVSLDYHPMQLLRQQSPFNRCVLAEQLVHKRNKTPIQVAGVVTGRQRPGSASGVIFMTLEDETGNMNIVLWQDIQKRFRKEILTGRILYIKGILETKHGVVHIMAGYIENHTDALPSLKAKSRDFH